jgi:hypothetical protein
VDPVSAGLLTALAGGAGGEAGRQAWAALGALVRRPFRRTTDGRDEAPGAAAESGEAQVSALERQPGDDACAGRLSAALVARAAADPEFHAALEQWERAARALGVVPAAAVHNEIRGGTQYGPVLQGQSFSGLSFTVGTPSPAPAPEPARPPDPADE